MIMMLSAPPRRIPLVLVLGIVLLYLVPFANAERRDLDIEKDERNKLSALLDEVPLLTQLHAPHQLVQRQMLKDKGQADAAPAAGTRTFGAILELLRRFFCSIPFLSAFLPFCNEEVQEVRRSCADHKAAGLTNSGIYTVDPDGESGPVQPFEIYCDQTTRGGGWALFAHIKDDEPVPSMNNPVNPNQMGVVTDEAWIALRDGMEDGILFVDENSMISRMSRAKLEQANCWTPWNITSLSLVEESEVGYFRLFHQEDFGCNGVGIDYCLVTMRRFEGDEYRWADNSLCRACAETTFWEEWGYDGYDFCTAQFDSPSFSKFDLHDTMSYYIR